MNVKHRLAPAIALLIGSTPAVCIATALPNGAILTINEGLPSYDSNGNFTGIGSGSWFGMDQDGNGRIKPDSEETPILDPNNHNFSTAGIVIGSTQTATGSHSGSINGSESPAYDIWEFFGNTGMDYTTVAPTGDTVSGLDFSGWTVTWNGISAINMGSGAWTPGNCAKLGCTGIIFADGVAAISWSGTSGDPYSLWYSATVPAGDPSGFGGVAYLLHLEGKIYIPDSLTVTGAGSIAPGPTGKIRANSNDLAAVGIPKDPDIERVVGLYYDFVLSSVTGISATVTIPLSAPIPDNATYRKYNVMTGNWGAFVEDTLNKLESAPGSPGKCNGVTWEPGLKKGYWCIRLTIEDNGPNDSDANIGTIADPGGIGIGKRVTVTSTSIAPSGTSGCTLGNATASERMDWWLVALSIIGLGVLRRRPN